uniref:Retrovirus-related Pol polyprotein from transposon TNT 1-94-like beta-barrel domain-containing protein n=1 Tax=Lactuca sativa TaxID=4236 RepID=A0A9R1XUF7_LACSA|nr:hypothetical protein LSAT_V11C100003880 [Lactuca sativa]
MVGVKEEVEVTTEVEEATHEDEGRPMVEVGVGVNLATRCKARNNRTKSCNEDEPTLLLTVYGERNTDMVLLNEEKVPIKGKGTLLIDCKNGDQFVIPDVYCILALHSNIISLGQMIEEGYDIGMKKEFLRMNDEAGCIVMKVQRSRNRLYKIRLTPRKPI